MKNRILNSAVKLISKNGINNVSYSEIAQEANVSKSLVFKKLKSREEAEIAFLKHSITTFKSYIDGKTKHLMGLDKLRTFFELWLDWTENSYLPGGCPMLMAVFELNGRKRTNKVRSFLIQHHQNFIKNLEKDLNELDLKAKVTSCQLAFSIVGIYTSHHIYKHHIGNKNSYTLAMKSFDSLFKNTES